MVSRGVPHLLIALYHAGALLSSQAFRPNRYGIKPRTVGFFHIWPQRCGLFHAATPHGVKTRAARLGKGGHMAEGNDPQVAQTDPTGTEPHGAEPTGGETVSKADYDKLLAQSRKWEKQSKANAEKAKAYDELKASTV